MLLKTVYDNSTFEMMGMISLKGEIQMVNRRFCEISATRRGTSSPITPGLRVPRQPGNGGP